LVGRGARIRAFDPVAMHESKRRIGDRIKYASDMYDALKNSDCLLIATEWSEFRLPDFLQIKKLLKTPVIFDGRNIYNLTEMKESGFDYFCIGIKEK
ncbi:MAG TPA: UDP-glucose/GDP-mannose dehydrogenase family protein, partial [Bacteroidales bacterium]|nr:UDP-glucose/GDP-mannose dehydrogenase family protein [Bacteroidales bacterium]